VCVFFFVSGRIKVVKYDADVVADGEDADAHISDYVDPGGGGYTCVAVCILLTSV
jgi:hypothetical protein